MRGIGGGGVVGGLRGVGRVGGYIPIFHFSNIPIFHNFPIFQYTQYGSAAVLRTSILQDEDYKMI